MTELPRVLALYGQDGLRPRTLLAAWSGGCVALLALALGLFSRPSAVAAYVFVVSVHLRNDAICNGGDYLSAMWLFFVFFLDIGAAYSLDARWFGRGRDVVPAAPWRAMQVRLALLYTLTAVFKLAGVWLAGDGIFVSLQHLGFVRPLGALLAEHPTLCRLMTWGVVATELAVGLLIVFPLRGRTARRYAAIGSTLVQRGILVMMRVGAFTWIMLWTAVLLWPEPTRAPVIDGPTPPRRKLMLAGFAIVLAETTWAGLPRPARRRPRGRPARRRARLSLGGRVAVLAVLQGDVRRQRGLRRDRALAVPDLRDRRRCCPARIGRSRGS